MRFCTFYVLFCAFLCFFGGFLWVKQRRQHFYAHKKHLRKRKWLAWRFVLLVLFMLFMLFMRVKKIWVKVACLRFVLFMLFVLFVIFVRVKSFRLKNKTALIASFLLLLRYKKRRVALNVLNNPATNIFLWNIRLFGNS